jgi:hypothetical protein
MLSLVMFTDNASMSLTKYNKKKMRKSRNNPCLLAYSVVALGVR